CGFSRVLIGLSGGIDSSLVAAIAVEAVGKENVTGVGMPGPYSSEYSVSDARIMAERLGVCFKMVPIGASFDACMNELTPAAADQKDSDCLHEYGVLDRVLEAYIEDNRARRGVAESLKMPIELVEDIVRNVGRSECERQQAAAG